MHLRFGPDDGDQFNRAKADLLDRFEAWISANRLAIEGDAGEVAGEAGLALDWKWGYGDGDLGRWTTDDVREFFLDWCPRKLSAGPEESATIPVSIAAFAAFLGEEGFLAPGSAHVDDLVRTTLELVPDFLGAMDDPANFGMAKSLFAAAAGDGVDLSDPEGMQDWIDEFNARPERERSPALPPVVPPDDAEVAASRAAAPILAKFAALADFAGAGRKLTQKGNITLADARALVRLLDTGDVMDPVYGKRTFRTTSSAELRTLHHVFIWARKAGVVRVAHGRMIATKKGLAIAKDPAAFFDRAVDALLALGALGSQRDPDGWLAWPDVTELLDRFTVHLLAGPYVAQRPLPIEDLCDAATEAVLSVFHFPNSPDDRIARHVATDVIDMLDALEHAGVVRRTLTAEPEDRTISRRREGGSVELTAAGTVTTRRLLEEAGYEAPTAGRLSDATATDLLLGTDADDFPVVAAEIEAWRKRRTPAEAAAQLADAVRTLPDPALRNLALAVMGEIGPEVAGPEVRTLATEPATRGFAQCWLVDHGLAEPGTLLDPADPSWFVDVLAHRMVTLGPEGLCDTLALAGDHQQQVAVIGRLWRSPSAATELALAALAQVHPVKAVAKAARKALFQRRSWSGGATL